MKVRYLHSEINTLERMEIIRDLRLGVFDVLVGINLLREGLNLPEYRWWPFLMPIRKASCGRKVPYPNHRPGGKKYKRPRLLCADTVTESMRRAISGASGGAGCRWNIIKV